MEEYNYEFIHFEEIPSSQVIVRFKEFYFCKEKMSYIPTVGSGYMRINLDAVEIIHLDLNNDIATIHGMIGKFFK